ncbi:MAG: REP-associated tyrosine transposase, partial [Planctomycetota bacterium]
MPDYRRLHVPGGTYFFTCVTYGRRKILTTDLGRECLRTAIEKTRSRLAIEIVAIVLLPDHWHTVWTLPQGDANYSIRWMRIKEEFSKHWLAEGGT